MSSNTKTFFPILLSEVRSMENLGKSIKEQYKNIDLIWSEIITRAGDHDLADKVTIFNNKLKKICETNNWGLIKHGNLTRNSLNKSRLQLNKEGTAILARNVKQYLRDEYESAS